MTESSNLGNFDRSADTDGAGCDKPGFGRGFFQAVEER